MNKKSDDYNKMIKSQSEDMANLIKQMRLQFWQIRDKHLRELVEIEQKYKMQVSIYCIFYFINFTFKRKELLDLHKKEINDKF